MTYELISLDSAFIAFRLQEHAEYLVFCYQHPPPYISSVDQMAGFFISREVSSSYIRFHSYEEGVLIQE
jgi:hypothetical protein